MSSLRNHLIFLTVLLFGLSVVAQPPLATLAQRSVETESDAVVVIHDGSEVFRYLPLGSKPVPIEIMSMTKSFASLAIGFLIDEKKISSVDEPLSKWFPEWRNSPKSKITLRHILTQTSGLEANRNAADIYQQKDVVKYALDAPLKDEPGKVHFYNNKAVNLLAGIVKKTSGIQIDQYLRKKLLNPLGIKDFHWEKDGSGNPLCMAGLKMSASDLAKIGQFLINDGSWNGRHLLAKSWIKLSTTPSELNNSYGFLWWLSYESWTTKVRDEELKAYTIAGLPKIFVDALASTQSRSDFKFNQLRQERKDLAASFVQFDQLYAQRKIPYPHQIPVGSPIGFSAEGSVGQQLVILPALHVVGVRQKIKHNDSDEENDRLQFDDFRKLLDSL